MKKIIKNQTDLSLDKLSEALKNPPQNVYVSVYTKRKIEVESVVKTKRERMTLAKLTTTVNGLVTTVNGLTTTVNGLTTTVNGLTKTVTDLAKIVSDGFKQVNERIDNIEKRLDYNNLKPLPKTK